MQSQAWLPANLTWEAAVGPEQMLAGAGVNGLTLLLDLNSPAMSPRQGIELLVPRVLCEVCLAMSSSRIWRQACFA